MNNPTRIGMLMFRYTRRELSVSEESELQAWRNLSPQNEELFQTETDPEHICQEISRLFESQERVYQKIKEYYPETEKPKPVSVMYRLARFAATTVILIGMTLRLSVGKSDNLAPGGQIANFISYDGISIALADYRAGYNLSSKGGKVEENDKGKLICSFPDHPYLSPLQLDTLRTPRGGEFAMKFPDSTMVWLDAASELRYPLHYMKDTIGVVIKGQAFIQVPENSKRVFQVEVNGARILTHGATINIQAHADEPEFRTTLLNGSAVYRTGNNDIHLTAGKEVYKTGDRLSVDSTNHPEESIDWRNDTVSFHNKRLDYIMRYVSRWYNADVVFEGPVPVKECNLDIARDADVKELLMDLARQGVWTSINKRTITIHK